MGPLPDKVTLRSSFGKIQSGEQVGEGSLDIALRNGVGRALLLCSGYAPDQAMPVEVTVAGNPFGFLASESVLLRDTDSITITQAPKTLAADGVAVGEFRAVVKDQLGQPLQGVPCFINYGMPDGTRDSPVVWSDARGALVFTLPPCAKTGMAEFQIEAEHTFADQTLVSYEAPAPKAR